jgi:hypothetical protein
VTGEFGKQMPISSRNDFYSLVFDELQASAAAGGPLVGAFLWDLISQNVLGANTSDGYAVFPDLAEYQKWLPDPFPFPYSSDPNVRPHPPAFF